MLLSAALLISAALQTPATIRVTVDSSRHRVILVAGPFHPVIAPYDHHAGHDELVPDDPIAQVAWPVNGWLRGFRVELVDGSGTLLNRDMLHHLKVVNFGRRQLVYPLTERLAAAERDASGAVRGVRRKLLAVRGSGLRLKAGRRYRLVAVYDNPTTETLTDVMGIMAGLFKPDDMRRWPAIDHQDSLYQLDLGLLRREPVSHAGH